MVSRIEPAKLSRRSVAVGLEGNAYVVNTENQAIRMIETKGGLITTIAGSGPDGRGFGGDGGQDGPNGAVYVADTNNHRVRWVWWGVAEPGVMRGRLSCCR